VRNPKLRDELVDDVEGYKGLSNTDATKVYKLEVEKGAKAKFLQRIRITPHAQYRMDQRGITISDVRVALMHFAKAFYDSKSHQGSFYQNRSEELARGEKILWVAKKIGRLAIVFVSAGQGTLTLVTTYWEGLGDPKPVDESVCKVAQRFALRQEPSPGVQTYVTDKSQLDLPNNKDNSDKEPPSAAPLPGSATPGGAGRDIGKFEFSTPGPNSDITPRTLGVPGEQYGNPTNVLNNYITRRTMTACEEDCLSHTMVPSAVVVAALFEVQAYATGTRGGPQPTRQHRQQPAKARLDSREYKQRKALKTRKALKRYHAFCKRNRNCLRQRQLYRNSPQRYKRRPPSNKEAGDIFLYDQENPANNEIKQPGADVNYRADSPSTYEKKPDEREGVPPGAEMPSNQTENVPPASGRVIPDQMKDTLREQQTYVQAGKTACVVAVTEIDGASVMLKVRDRNYVPRIKVIRDLVAGTEIAHLFDTWTGWSEGVNEYGIGVVSSALLVEVDEGQKKVPTGDSGTGRKIREILGAQTMDAAIEILMGNLVKGCTFISDGKRSVLVEYDGNPNKGGTEPELHTLKSGVTMVRTNHGVFLEGAGYTDEYQDGSDLKSSEVRRDTAEKVLGSVAEVGDVAAAMARSRKKDRADPLNAVRADPDGMTTSTQIVIDPSAKTLKIYLVPDEVDFVGVDNQLPKGRKPKVDIEIFEFKGWDTADPKPVEIKGGSEVFRLFTYGSMMHKPSYSKDVIRSYKATLKGHHRAYNRTSQSRDGIYVLGTEPGGNIEGVVHEYPSSVGHRVLGQVDRREGFRTERPEDKNSYLRKAINVKTPEGIARATVYLSNPEGPNYHKPLTPEQAAKEIVGVPKAEKYLRSISKALEEYGSKSSYVKKVERQSEKRKAVKTAMFPVELPDNNEPNCPVYDTEFDTCSELPNGQEKTAAANVEEILDNCGLQLKGRAQDVSYGRKRLSPSGLSTWVASGSRGEKYTIRIKPIRKNKRIKAVAKLPIQVSCSCPYFRWQGPEHWAKKHGYLYGRQVGTASTPNIKDPKGRHWACKHVIAVLQLARKWRYSSESEWSYEGDIVPMPHAASVAAKWALRNPKFGPNIPLGEWDETKVKYRIKTGSEGILMGVYYGRKKIAWMDAYTQDNPERYGKCREDVQKLVDRYPALKHHWVAYNGKEMTTVRGLYISHAFINVEEHRGKGIGKAMYEAVMREWFKKKGPFVFIPYYCTIGSGTSLEAKRVWDSLAKRFPSSGHAVAVLKAP
jgi:cation transport regulator ChaC